MLPIEIKIERTITIDYGPDDFWSDEDLTIFAQAYIRLVLDKKVGEAPGRFKVVSKSPDGSIQLEKLPQ